jgi:3-methyladenine DNA glycosylase AlkD
MNRTKSNFTKHTESELQKISPMTNQKFFGENYIGGGQSRLKYLNLKIPSVRAVFLKKKLIDKNLSEIENLWFESNIFEVKSLALIWLEKQTTEFLLENIKKIFSWAVEIDNWALSDGYCGILARAFESDQKKLLPTYKKWNKHKNPWLRRISMVGLFYYSRARKIQPRFNLAISMIKPHMSANEYYLQKAVGWTLRECYNVYAVQTTDFITKNLSQIHSDAWYAASEKMPVVLKNKLVLKRRENRRK